MVVQNRFSIPQLEKDVNDYIIAREKWLKIRKWIKYTFHIIYSETDLKNAYNIYLRKMKTLETKYTSNIIVPIKKDDENINSVPIASAPPLNNKNII